MAGGAQPDQLLDVRKANTWLLPNPAGRRSGASLTDAIRFEEDNLEPRGGTGIGRRTAS